jgi:pimeloyl-ACP methyl ester carboxylesterase
MIGDSLGARVALNTTISSLSSILPLAVIHHVLDWWQASPLGALRMDASARTIFYAIHIWFAIELLFYGYFLYTRKRLQRISNYIPLSDKECVKLFERSLAEIGDLGEFLSGWFRVHQTPHVRSGITRDLSCRLEDIYVDNIREWLAWAFYGKTLEQVAKDEVATARLTWMIERVSQVKQHVFPAGYNPNVRALRLNVEPFSAKHRPFILYVALLAVDALTKLILHAMGFRPYGRQPRGIVGFFASLIDNIRQADLPPETTSIRDEEKVTYWYRPPVRDTCQTTTPEPIMFIHGLGGGLAPFLMFIAKILFKSGRDTPVYLLDMPHLSMRLCARAPSIPETARAIESALIRHGHQRAVLIGHSFGSAVVAYLCRQLPKRVAGVVLVDPICFLLLEAAVAWRFVRRIPERASERFVEYFASRELFTSYFISRRFHWYHAILWADELPEQATVYLSESDLLVPSPQVSKYLSRESVKHYMMPGDHAHFLFRPRWENDIVNQAVAYSRA